MLQNRITGSRVTAILLNWWVLPVSGSALGRVCALSLRSRLVSKLWQSNVDCILQGLLGKGPKKNPKCKLFPKGGGGYPKVYISKKFIHSEKRLQMDFFNTRMCFGKF
jgi:hypothetical protein